MTSVNIQEIISILPHRYPFLLIDKVIKLLPGSYAIGVKNITVNEPQFVGHFPGIPIMPGVLIIEAMAQLAAILVAKTINASPGEQLVYLVGVDKTKFRKVIEPGNTLVLEVSIEQSRNKVWRFKAIATVDEQIAAESYLTAMVKDKVSN